VADSADDLLRQAREALNDWITADAFSAAEQIASGRLASAFEMLDALMSAGGPLPTDWVPAAGRTVTDVPGPDGDGLRQCVTCGARIRRVNARDGIDPADMDGYPWVDGSGNPFCDGPPVHIPRGGA
jgi:hypothetical protein